MIDRPTPEQLNLAHRIALEVIPDDTFRDLDAVNVAVRYLVEQGALAAIIETTELTAAYARSFGEISIADNLRSGSHLKGSSDGR